MNSRILVRDTGTPTWRALVWAPPTAKIQLPPRIRSNSHVATMTTAIAQNVAAYSVSVSRPGSTHGSQPRSILTYEPNHC